MYYLTVPDLPLIHTGKTRDTYGLYPEYRLIVASDRISTHNIVHKSLIPSKGEVLTALTVYWARRVLDPAGIPHHIVASGMEIYNYLPGRREDYPEDLHRRAIVVRDLQMIPVEFIFRSYLAGSLWDKFYSKGKENPYGVFIPDDMKLMSAFAGPVFTPTDKSETDDPLSAEETRLKYSSERMMALQTFVFIQSHLRDQGLEMIDSKFEVGRDVNGKLYMADEFGTPDSSRFALLSDIKVGQNPPWLDKQIARDAAEKTWAGGDKYPLTFDQEVVVRLSALYLQTFFTITDMTLEKYYASL